jgi:hypothetical protein
MIFIYIFSFFKVDVRNCLKTETKQKKTRNNDKNMYVVFNVIHKLFVVIVVFFFNIKVVRFEVVSFIVCTDELNRASK